MNAHGAASALSMTASSSSSSAVSKVAASLSSSSTSSTGNWRGKYLRALNISAPEVDISRKTPRSASGSCSSATISSSSAATQQQQLRRARSYRVDANRSVTFSRSFHTATEREGDEFQARVNRYQVSHLARTSSRRQLQSSSSNSRSAYGFAVKPDLARGRRCHTDPVVSDDKVSAPIEIPSGAAALRTGATLSDIVGDNNSDSRYSSRSPLARHSSRSSNNNNNASQYRLDATAGKLLSWEEPSVMLALEPQQQLGGLDMAFSNLHLDRRSSSRSGATGTSGDDLFYCDEFVDTDDEEDEDDEDEDGAAAMSSDDDDDPIFAMEDFASASSRDNNDDAGLVRKSSSRDKSRRRLRTAASASMLVAPPPSGRTAALSRFHSVRQLRCGTGSSSPSSHGLELPASFVPPHEMIQRDCFSIGLRDEFKRRHAKI